MRCFGFYAINLCNFGFYGFTFAYAKRRLSRRGARE